MVSRLGFSGSGHSVAGKSHKQRESVQSFPAKKAKYPLNFLSGRSQIFLFGWYPRELASKQSRQRSASASGGNPQAGLGASSTRTFCSSCPSTTLSLPRLLLGRRIWPSISDRCFSSVICRRGNSCGSVYFGQYSSRDHLDRRVLPGGRDAGIWSDMSLSSTGVTHKLQNRSCRQR